ncbi:hypothetical protein XOC_1902 [Xanthomonas oryzae pv. oryzicola BLS256]|uniref:Uncharacterized protein n=1 Tax=Xanthomonas oryzae pv. oryzicola (strain BLS256) TaxID=383407 RepID=G7TAU4_XANOB|nr:hypothetical protein XOC_1902 [Xanthomonas oryzae pv. oryzicola BLS256]
MSSHNPCLRQHCLADAWLVYDRAPAAPHWPGDEGFFCERCLAGIALPLR